MLGLSNKFREQVYTNAYVQYGEEKQLVVAIEELSECQKVSCKVLRGKPNLEHLAEEVADAKIMLEQIQMYFDLNDKVDVYVDEKIRRLDRRLRGCPFGETVGE